MNTWYLDETRLKSTHYANIEKRKANQDGRWRLTDETRNRPSAGVGARAVTRRRTVRVAARSFGFASYIMSSSYVSASFAATQLASWCTAGARSTIAYRRTVRDGLPFFMPLFSSTCYVSPLVSAVWRWRCSIRVLSRTAFRRGFRTRRRERDTARHSLEK
jgi:hypothetical protein